MYSIYCCVIFIQIFSSLPSLFHSLSKANFSHTPQPPATLSSTPAHLSTLALLHLLPQTNFSSSKIHFKKHANARRHELLSNHPPQMPSRVDSQRPLGASKGEYVAWHISSKIKVGKQPPAPNTKACFMLCG